MQLTLSQILGLAASDKTTDANKQASTITTTDVTLNSKLVDTYSVERCIKRSYIKFRNKLLPKKILEIIIVSAVENTEVIKIAVKNENASYACKNSK